VTKDEFDVLLADEQNPTMSYVVDFRVRVKSMAGYPLTAKGSHNRQVRKTTYTLFTDRRIFALDFDRSHGDAGGFHLHEWNGSECDTRR
jgi:hypothetical protein